MAPIAAVQEQLAVDGPLVSCIMPTYNRTGFVQQAIRYFLRQDYPNVELLIVDDGTDPVFNCTPEDVRIRYIRLGSRLTVGAKRNLACEQTRGEFIFHWDDDDWYPSSRVRVQLRALLNRPADVCGTSRLFYYEPATDGAWEYTYAAPGVAWVAGNTLAYRKTFWECNRFPAIQIGEDSSFIWTGVGTIFDLADPALCIGMVHPTNVSFKETNAPSWHPIPSETIRALLGDDLHFYDLTSAKVTTVCRMTAR